MKNRIVVVLVIVCVLLVACCFAGCAPTQSSESNDQSKPSTETPVAWSMDMECSQCHAAESTSAKEANGCLAKVHADLSYTCIDCHTDESALAGVHENAGSATPATKLKKTEVSSQACLLCHDSREALAQKTTDIAIVDDAGKAVNPHALPASKDHDEIECAECHVSHKSVETLQEAKSMCASCHHAGVFECGTCHS
ncbi:MAG: cytochrome c3 family protein [Raoultibacter sp.]